MMYMKCEKIKITLFFLIQKHKKSTCGSQVLAEQTLCSFCPAN
jgi:hypothetical protein